MAHKLVIVESPAKARTIEGYLGRGYVVESSIGHIRDLPHTAAEIPARIKSEPWARLGVDVDNGFEPVYVVRASHDAGWYFTVPSSRASARDSTGPTYATQRCATSNDKLQ